MNEPPISPFSYGNLLGRKVLVTLPVFVLVLVTLAVFIALPVRYFFAVNHGTLHLMVGKVGWLDSHISRLLEPIPVKDVDVTELTEKVFESESDAFAVLKSFFESRVKEGQAKVFPKEKELAEPYRALLRDLKAARAAGAQGLDKNIDMLQGWMGVFTQKTEGLGQAHKGQVRETVSTAIPSEGPAK